MPKAVFIGHKIQGMTTGEHEGHGTPHPPSVITGNTTSGAPHVFIGGIPMCRIGDTTVENDNCDTNQVGHIAEGSSSVFINGIAVAWLGSKINPHNGTAEVIEGCDYVFIGR